MIARIVPLLLAAACTFEPGGAFGTIEEATLTTAFDRGARERADGRFLVMGGYYVAVDEIELELGTVSLEELVGSGGGGGGVFDPASPPPGYTFCHGGHCHATDGRLVPYEEIQAELAGGGASRYEPMVAMPVDRAIDLSEERVTVLDVFEPSRELSTGTISRATVEVIGFRLAGRVTGAPLADRDVPILVDLAANGVLSSIEASRDVSADAPAEIRVALEMRLVAAFMDGLDLASLETPGGVVIQTGAPAETLIAAILGTPLAVTLE